MVRPGTKALEEGGKKLSFVGKVKRGVKKTVSEFKEKRDVKKAREKKIKLAAKEAYYESKERAEIKASRQKARKEVQEKGGKSFWGTVVGETQKAGRTIGAKAGSVRGDDMFGLGPVGGSLRKSAEKSPEFFDPISGRMPTQKRVVKKRKVKKKRVKVQKPKKQKKRKKRRRKKR